MRIISPFKDYYDNAGGYWHDSTCNFFRKTEEHINNKNDQQIINELTYCNNLFPEQFEIKINSTEEHFYESGSIAFCGTIYPFLKLDLKKKFIERKAFEKASEVWRIVQTKFFYNEDLLLKQAKDYIKKYRLYRNISNKRSINVKIFKYFNSPILLIQNRTDGTHQIIKNPKLSNLKFQQVINPLEAYQQIERYIANDMRINEDKIPKINDKDMIGIKGFDKWSFRKMPEKTKG